MIVQFTKQRLPRFINRLCNRSLPTGVPLIVAVGTVATTLLLEMTLPWLFSQVKTIATDAVAFTTAYDMTPKISRSLLGAAINRQYQLSGERYSASGRIVTTTVPYATPRLMTLRTNDITRRQRNVFTLRGWASIKEESEGESWESDRDGDNSLDETLASLLESDTEHVMEQDGEMNDSMKPNVANIFDNDSDATDPLMVEYERWSIAVDKAIAALENKRFSLQQELTKAEQLESVQTRAQLLQTYRHLFTTQREQSQSVMVQDWETGEDVVLSLDSRYESIGDEIEALFSQAKKLKRGKKVVGTLFGETVSSLNSMLDMKVELDAALLSTSNGTVTTCLDGNLLSFIQERLIASSRQTNFVAPKDGNDESVTSRRNIAAGSKVSRIPRKPELGSPASNVRKIVSPAGCTILVGRSRRGNEYISLNLALNNDIWMHARNTPGAHVLVVQRRGGIFATENCFQLAADLAAFYSDARAERNVLVSVAEPKHVQKPRGAPLGAVKLREELRTYSGHPDDVPSELKEARAVSGTSDEYRIKDKSKLRKQNKQRSVTKRKAKESVETGNQKEADNFF